MVSMIVMARNYRPWLDGTLLRFLGQITVSGESSMSSVIVAPQLFSLGHKSCNYYTI